MSTARYRVYREHKLVTYMLSDYQRTVGKADFRDNKVVADIKKQLDGIISLMKGHAEHEDKRIHQFLRDRSDVSHMHIEEDHKSHDQLFSDLTKQLDSIESSSDSDQRENLGYHFYLAVRRFEGENLLHLHEEETVIMPALQALYTDAELRTIDAPNYEEMTAEQMVHMFKALFQHFNPQDRRAFLTDIQYLQPTKFIQAWKGIEGDIKEEERNELISLLHINVNDTDYQAVKPADQNLRYAWEAGEGEAIQTTYEKDSKKNLQSKLTFLNTASQSSSTSNAPAMDQSPTRRIP
ncbi:MAG: hemerythrin domain-containing protein [Pseudomonadota bacterium]